MKSTKNIREFRSSYSRCTSKPEFINTFHGKFMSTSAEAQKHFASIPEDKQKKMLEYALYLQMLAIDETPEAVKCLEDLGDLHVSLDVEPHLYDHWLDCLAQTVEKFDGANNPGIGNIWREVLRDGLERMKK